MATITHDGPITIAVGNSRKSLTWQNKDMMWSELVERLDIPERTAETALEYKALPKAQRDDIKDVGGFVGGTLQGGRRKADAILDRRLLTLDLDEVPAGADPWSTVVLVLGCAAVMYSTHSHTEAAPRLRLVMPLSRPVTPEEYAAVSRKIAQDIGIDLCDDTTYEPHRLMYWPSLPYDAQYRYAFEDGPWLDPDEQLRRYADWHDPAQWPTSSRRADALVRMAKKQGSPLEKDGVVGAFCRTYDIEDAIDQFLPDTYLKCDDGRYTYAAGSTTGGLVLYESGLFAYSHHGTDPASGKLCNAFDLVRIHLFGQLDDSASPGTPGGKLPSYIAMVDEAIKIPEVREELARMNLEKLKDNFDDVDETLTGEPLDMSWTQELTVSKKGKTEDTIDNIRVIMENDIHLRGNYYFDSFKERMTVCGDLPWVKLKARSSVVWNDTDDAGLRGYIEKCYGISNASKINDAVLLAMLKFARHPVREYLESVTWDGTRRAETLFIDYMGAADNSYVRSVTRKALVGAVARIMEPGCKHDHILVLVGPQGVRKSTTLAKLGRTWFSDSLYTVQGKEAYEQIQGYWIIEMGEMAATRKAELEQIKQFVSKQTDSFRAAYARRVQEHPRQCAFFGTTNDEEFMRDDTGGRRFWPVTVTEKGRTACEALTPEIVDQIWAEALTCYRAGECWYLDDPKIERMAAKVQEDHTERNARQGLVEQFLDRKLPKNWAERSLDQRLAFWGDGFEDEKSGATEERKTVCALEIYCELLCGQMNNYSMQNARELNGILTRLPGWERSSCLDFGPIYGRQRGFRRKD